MPAWIHDRAKHIRRENPDMPESMSYAIATQQAHATGNTPKGYGTSEGKREAKEKYDEPGKMKQTADPRHKSKSASSDLAFWMGFSDEIAKIATALAMPKPKPMVPKPTSVLRETLPTTPMKDPLSSTKTTTPPPLTAGA